MTRSPVGFLSVIIVTQDTALCEELRVIAPSQGCNMELHVLPGTQRIALDVLQRNAHVVVIDFGCVHWVEGKLVAETTLHNRREETRVIVIGPENCPVELEKGIVGIPKPATAAKLLEAMRQ